jgi:type I restriction enzyme S subunit
MKNKGFPKIRFKKFTYAWEQRKVLDLLSERNIQAPKSFEYPLMAFIQNQGVAPKGERYDRSSLVTDTENKLYKQTEYGDFIYSSNNLETGSIGLNKFGNACISPVYSIFSPTGIADSDFIGKRFVRKDFINEMIKWRQGVVYGQWRIHETDFLKINLSVPSLSEQRKIGAFFSKLDNLITLHQRKYFLFSINLQEKKRRFILC